MIAHARTPGRRPDADGVVVAALEAVVVLAAGLALGAGAWALAAAAAAVVVAHAGGLHRTRLVPTLRLDAPALLVAALATGVLTSALTGLVALVGLLGVHAVARAHRRWSHVRDPRRVVVLGTGPEARRVAETLLTCPEAGLLPVGFVAGGPGGGGMHGRVHGRVRGLPLAYLGDDLSAAVAGTRAEVVVATEPHDGPLPVEGYALGGPAAELGLVRLGEPTPGAVRVARRVGAALVALVLLVLLLPVVAVVAAAVRLETGGVLVRDGDRVRLRTRRAHSLARAGTTWSVAISGKVGPVGRLLLRTRLDALPQAVRHLVRQVVGHRVPRRLRRAPAGVPLAQRPRRAATSRR